MGRVFDFATREQRPVESDPTIGPSSERETEGMTPEELDAFWRGAAWSARQLYGPSDPAVDWKLAAEGQRVVNEYRAGKRARLGVV